MTKPEDILPPKDPEANTESYLTGFRVLELIKHLGDRALISSLAIIVAGVCERSRVTPEDFMAAVQVARGGGPKP